ncbi:RagB/SusD family nutrient uptake outer membrane protein [Niabella drilacis]|uniref:Starch-binding associating with outer membrane n=1 Tax=Niabella drilacis (strain DSM 25811 / CCM 8410 / CCUG 62505 / LMG 26954 / E90) TaxID=1285928 RepID=A0A1G6L4K7_NIADE|nr:RagB/SusD family nutrient uptake outer membrane protein [Niabella drilacis]SDC38053.1 Starch-binding associating with outer membrane [Niabella drilacis]
MKKYIIACLVISIAASCKKYLDIIPDNVATIEYAFRNRNETENYLFSCYQRMQNLQAPENNPGWTSSGELIMRNNLTGINFGSEYNVNGFWVLYGNLSPYGTAANTNIQNDFSGIYVAIRRCNTFLENVNIAPDLGLDEKTRWISEVKTLKAFYYYWLVRKYGPVPLVKVNQPIYTPTEEARVPRAPSDSVFAYIYSLIDEALPGLPPAVYDVSTEYGRFTQVMAATLKAKAAVLQASPLFNGDNDFKTLANKDGTRLFPQEYDASKWSAAAEACRKALDICEDQGATLYKYVKPTNNTNYIPDSIMRLLSIQGPVNFDRSVNAIIPEVIWPGNVINRHQRYFASLASTSATRSVDGDAVVAVPLNMAELFYTNNGVPIDEDETYDYAGRYTTATAGADHKYYISASGPTARLHFNREPRFYADLAFDRGIWYGMGVENAANASGLNYAKGYPGLVSSYTGYWPKKLVNYKTTFNGNSLTEVAYYPPVIRLADLQLLYAEALNEAQGPNAEAYRYIDSVRFRAGLQGVVQSWATYSSNAAKPFSKDGLRSIIHQERRIELCFEGEIGWDLKRWKEYLSVNALPYQGWNYRGTTTASDFYRLTNLFSPNITEKNYFWPFDETVILNNPLIVQNLYW